MFFHIIPITTKNLLLQPSFCVMDLWYRYRSTEIRSHGGKEQSASEGSVMSNSVGGTQQVVRQSKKDGNEVVTCPHCHVWKGKRKRLPKHTRTCMSAPSRTRV